MSASLVSAGLRSHQPEDSATGQFWPPPALKSSLLAPGATVQAQITVRNDITEVVIFTIDTNNPPPMRSAA